MPLNKETKPNNQIYLKQIIEFINFELIFKA